MAKINSPYPQFVDIDGDPLEAGYVYIGQAGLNPEVSPISVYTDSALSVPIAQPIRTLGGIPVSGSSPVQLYCVENNFSITVRNKNLTLVRSALDATSELFLPGVASFATVMDAKAGQAVDGTTVDYALLTKNGTIRPQVSTIVNNATSNAGGGLYTVWTLAAYRASIGDGTWVPDGYGDHYVDGGTTYVLILEKGAVRDVMQYGVVLDTSHADGTSNYNAVAAALNRSTYAFAVEVKFPAGDIYFGANGFFWGHYRTLRGVARERTRLRFEFDGSDEEAFLIDQFNYFYDFQIINDGSDQTTSAGWVSYVATGSGANGAANCVVENVDIRNFGANITASQVGGSRLTFSNVFNTRFIGVRCYNGNNNVLLGAGVNNTTFIDCWFKDSRSRNIRGSEWLSATFIGCADEGTAATAFSGYFTLCQNVRFINSYHEPMRGFFLDTCPGFVLDRPQLNGFAPVTSGTGSNRLLSAFWTLNGSYSFSTPSPVFVYAPVFNTTDDLSSYTSWISGASSAPVRLVGTPTDRSGTLPQLPESYLLRDSPTTEIADNSVSPSAEAVNIARTISYGQFALPASGSAVVADITNEFGILVAKVFNTSGTFRVVYAIAGSSVSILESSSATGSVFSFTVVSGDLTYTDLTGAISDFSVQAAFYSIAD